MTAFYQLLIIHRARGLTSEVLLMILCGYFRYKCNNGESYLTANSQHKVNAYVNDREREEEPSWLNKGLDEGRLRCRKRDVHETIPIYYH